MSDYFPEEVLIEILSRLPVKSLLRFTCVSKPWRSLITSPSFINTHLNKSTNNTLTHLLLLRYTCLNPNQEHYSLRFDNKTFNHYAEFTSPFKTHFYFRVVGTCNGLVCLSDDQFGDKHNIILWNPMIRKHVAHPKPILSLDSYIPYMSVLGFGFDLRTNDYKVVRISHFERRKNAIPLPKVKVYSLKTGSWKALTCGQVTATRYGRFCSVIEIHRCVGCSDCRSGRNGAVIAITACYAPLRNVVDSEEFEPEALVESGVAHQKDNSVVKMGLEEAHKGWESGELLMGTRGGDMVSYQPESKRIEKHGLHGVKGSFYATPYVESLVLLNGSNGEGK
ncbi:hypothetical protein HYC85_026784 [Camellia sinensis]|uniref:F-box domain-containing protein n=1 Tax=Camellia sinensis TaxID=4442 RepID=A0A7J7G5S1_CAMSI|nr:hypothetical protein HYC85_026784 [Camellia sinensis]